MHHHASDRLVVTSIAPGLISQVELIAFLADRGFHVDRITPYARGVASKNFRALGPEIDLTVRCDYRRPLESVQEDRYFSELARSQGVNVPEGPWYDGYINNVAVSARRTVAGKVISDLPDMELPRPADLAAMLAKIHSLPPPRITRNYFYSAVFDASDTLWTRFAHSYSTLGVDATLLHLMNEALDKIRFIRSLKSELAKSPVAVIHGDFNPPNILSDGDRVTLIDWEKACFGPTISDIVQAVYYSSNCYDRTTTSFASEFIDSYLSKVSIDRSTLRVWLAYFPAFIFMRDTVSATSVPGGHNGTERQEKSLEYLKNDSAPRFKYFLENEPAMISTT